MQNIARYGKASNRLYFESKKESKLNQSMNIETIFSNAVYKYYHTVKIVLKDLS